MCLHVPTCVYTRFTSTTYLVKILADDIKAQYPNGPNDKNADKLTYENNYIHPDLQSEIETDIQTYKLRDRRRSKL